MSRISDVVNKIMQISGEMNASKEGGGGGLANGETERLELFVPPSMMKDNFLAPPPPKKN